jgi:hypothetical protein
VRCQQENGDKRYDFSFFHLSAGIVLIFGVCASLGAITVGATDLGNCPESIVNSS